MNWHAHSLRTGRYSERGRIYLVTTVTAGRAPLFADFRVARAVVHELQRSDETGLCRTLAYVLMPDHLHWLVELVEGDLSRVAGRFKSSAAAAVNRELGTLLTAVDSRTNPASTAGTAQHDLDLVSG